MKFALVILIALVPVLGPAATATTQLCAQQTSLALFGCATVGTFQGGDGSCETTGSYRGGRGSAFVGAGDTGRGVAFDNGCYAYSYDGQPYEGSQVAARAFGWGPEGYQDDGAYLNTGTFHGTGGDHEYCYVSQLDENGESRDGLRVDCPVPFKVPILLGTLP